MRIMRKDETFAGDDAEFAHAKQNESRIKRAALSMLGRHYPKEMQNDARGRVFKVLNFWCAEIFAWLPTCVIHDLRTGYASGVVPVFPKGEPCRSSCCAHLTKTT